MCDATFPGSSYDVGLDTTGDVSVIKLSTMILNDLPAADPRWTEGKFYFSFLSLSYIFALLFIHSLYL